MWGIAVIVAACCLAFGAVDAAAKMREKKMREKKQATSNSESDTESALTTLTRRCEQTLSYTQNANQQAQRSNDD